MTTPDTSRMLERLEQLVNIETGTGNHGGISRAFDLVEQWLPGRRVEAFVAEDGTRHLYWPSNRAEGPMLLAHIDTVFPLGTVEERPFSVDDGVARGPGVFDMKAGIVIAAEAIEMARDGAGVSLLVTSDEELGSPSSRSVIESLARQAGFVLITEPSLDGEVKTARRGAAQYRLRFTGRAAHAGLEPEMGRSALVALAAIVTTLTGWSDPERGTTVNPTVASAGTTINVIPEHAALAIDVRARTVAELERVDAAMRRFGDARGDGVDVVVEGGINRPPLEAHSSEFLLSVANDVCLELGLATMVGCEVGGASDGNFTAAVGTPTLDGLGPVGGGAHAETEWVSVVSMSDRARLVAGMLDRLADGG